MASFVRVGVLSALFSVAAMPVAASPFPESPADQADAFDQAPVTTVELSETYGAADTVAERQRQMVATDAAGDFRQIGTISRVIMDNWWGQTGAALVFNNLLARP